MNRSGEREPSQTEPSQTAPSQTPPQVPPKRSAGRVSAGAEIPQIPAWFQDGFHRFLTPYFKRHFHALAIHESTRENLKLVGDQNLLVYGNHPSWWDPLVAHFLNRSLLAPRQFFAPIDAAMLDQYKVFGKLGFYGVRMSSMSGASAFLKQSQAILDQPNSAIWMTPEGQFADARDHSVPLMPGLSHLCSRRTSGIALPLALEYVFWDERLPVCLARLGPPIRMDQHDQWDKSTWNDRLTAALRENQDLLAQAAKRRSSVPFENLLKGTRGAGAVYDSFRRAKAWATGQEFRAQHGDQFE